MILGDWNVMILFDLSHFASWEKRTFRQNQENRESDIVPNEVAV